MTYNEQLANRVREFLATSENNIVEKRMFGGLCFMVNDKMLAGVESERMMLRIGPDLYEEALEKEGCTPMDFTGKSMIGFVFVDADVLATNKELSWWLNLALAYNSIAPVSKKKTAGKTTKKAAAPKPIAKKATPQKAAPKKSSTAKAANKKSAPKKAAAKKSAAAAKPAPTKKASTKKAATKRSAPKKPAAKKQAPAKKAARKTALTQKLANGKAVARKR